MGRKEIRIIPNKLFFQLWKEASSSVSVNDYIDKFISIRSDKRIPFANKYGINQEEAYVLLRNIYEAYSMSFKDILDHARIKKSQASYEFCIPIRTIEDWCSGKNKCPSYIKLSVIRAYRLLDLGKYIYLESEIDYLNRKKPVYNKSKKTQAKENTTEKDFRERRTITDGVKKKDNKYSYGVFEDNTSYDNDDYYDYKSFNRMYSESASHISYAELQRRMKSYSEKSKESTTEYAYDDYLRRKREKQSNSDT